MVDFLDSPVMYACSWLFIPLAVAPLILFLAWLRRFLSAEDKAVSSTREWMFFILALVLLAIVATLVAFSPDSPSPMSADDQRDLAGILSVARGIFVPIRGPSIAQLPVYMGPFYYLYEALFAKIFAGPLFVVAAGLVSLSAAMLAGAGFLRRTVGRTSVLVWLLLFPLVVGDQIGVLTHDYLGLTFGVLSVWILWSSVNRNSDRYIPLLFLGIGVSIQFYAVNVVWIAAAFVVLYAFPLKVSHRVWLKSIVLLLFPQLFTIAFLIMGFLSETTFGGRGIVQVVTSSAGLPPDEMLLKVAPALVAFFLTALTGIFWLIVASPRSRIGRAFDKGTLVSLTMSSVVLVIAGVMWGFGVWERRYEAFLWPIAGLGLSAIASRTIDFIADRFAHKVGWVKRIAVPFCVVALLIACLGEVFAAFVPDESGESLRDRFSWSRFGGATLQFIDRNRINSKVEYLTHAHALVANWGPFVPPMFPMYYLPEENNDSPPSSSNQLLFMPPISEAMSPALVSSHTDVEFLEMKYFSVIGWQSRMRLAALPLIVSSGDGGACPAICGRRIGQSDSYAWPAYNLAAVSDEGRDSWADRRAADGLEPPRCEYASSSTVTMKIPVEAGNERTLVAVVAKGDRVDITFNGTALESGISRSLGSYKKPFPIMMHTRRLGREAGLLTLSVVSPRNCVKIFNVMDIPLSEDEILTWLGQPQKTDL